MSDPLPASAEAPAATRPGEPRRDLPPALRALFVFALLYLFLVGVGLIEEGISTLGAGFQEGLLEQVDNPLAGLFAGILATVLVQSSSVSTSTIVGLVGAGTLTLGAAVPMIMGANIGTTVTNTLASLGHVRRKDEFVRAFAGATMHDFFNVLAVIVFLPLELATGFLSTAAENLTRVLRGTGVEGGKASSPIKEAVEAPVGVIADVVGYLPTDAVTGIVLLVLGLLAILGALTFITRNMRTLIAGGLERAMNRIIGRGGGVVGLGVGLVVTVLVQSSSITTSILIPIVAAGVLTLRNAYPITLGANLGTTITALLASLAVEAPEGLTIALVHSLFNVCGILVFYAIPVVRDVPVRLAVGLARAAISNRTVVAGYVIGAFIVVPLGGMLLLG